MPTLDFMLPPVLSAAPNATEGKVAPEKLPATGAEPFDDLMARALSPDSQASPAATELRQNHFAGKSSSPVQTPGRTDSQTPEATGTNSKTWQPQFMQAGARSSGQHDSESDEKVPANNLAGKKNQATVDAASLASLLVAPLAGDPNVAPTQVIRTRSSGLGASEPRTPWHQAAIGAAGSNAPDVLAAKICSPTGAPGKSDSTPGAASQQFEGQRLASAINDLAADKQAATKEWDSHSSSLRSSLRGGDAKSGNSPAVTTPTPTQGGASLDAQIFQSEIVGPPSRGHPALAAGVTKTPPANDGTRAAKIASQMKNTEKTNKIAGSSQKNLPSNVISLASENKLPGASLASASARNSQPATAIGVGPIAASTATAALDQTSGNLATSSIIDLRSRAVERMHDMVALQATRLQDSSLDSLQVVIKPGAGMQLSLSLQQHRDGIDAQAVLQRGDLNYLSQHWPELQQRLEQRGVRLAPLTGQENTANGNGQSGYQQPQPQPAEQDPLLASAFAEFALAGPASSSAASSAGTPRVWETWA